MILPGSILDQGAGQLGGRATLGLTGGILQERILMASANNRNVSQSYILSLDYKVRTAGPALSCHLVRARIIWGSAKGNGDVTVDIKHGTRVELEGSSLTVDAMMVFTNLGAIPDAGPDVEVYASIGDGSIGKGPQLTFTDQTVALAAAANQIFDIPSYAREVEIQNAADPLAIVPVTYTVDFLSANAVGARIISRHTGTDTRFAIPNGAEAIRINNNGPGNIAYTPVFHLSL